MSPQISHQRYQITERIDAGGMAEVFRGKISSLKGFEKEIAIKRILPSLTQDQRFVRMFLDEAKLSLFLNHANIVQVFDIGEADGTYFIVMEFIDGANLKGILNALAQIQRRLPIEQAVFIAIEICKGLDYAHERKGPEGQPLKIVHRDVSPPNVLVSRDGEVKLTDFGLAKAVIQLEHTDPGIVKGKFGYLSPEAAYGESVDPRTDIFAVGIVLWEMLAGRRLFLGETDLKTLEQVRQAHVPALAQYDVAAPPELERILHKTLNRDRDKRYHSARELSEELTRFLFSYGKPATTFDLARLVKELVDAQPAPEPLTTSQQTVIDLLIQNELEKFISLEERQDLNELNVVGAKPLTIDDLENQSAASYPAFGFEDPRTWSDALADDKPLELDLTQQPPDPDVTAPQAQQTREAVTSDRPSRAPHASPPPAVKQAAEPEDEEQEDGSVIKLAWIIFIVLLVLFIVAVGVLALAVVFSG